MLSSSLRVGSVLPTRSTQVNVLLVGTALLLLAAKVNAAANCEIHCEDETAESSSLGAQCAAVCMTATTAAFFAWEKCATACNLASALFPKEICQAGCTAIYTVVEVVTKLKT